jgi:hypothetical protein
LELEGREQSHGKSADEQWGDHTDNEKFYESETAFAVLGLFTA